MKLKFLSLFLVLGIFTLGTNVKAADPEVAPTAAASEDLKVSVDSEQLGFSPIAVAACKALRRSPLTKKFCLSACDTGSVESIGACIKNIMTTHFDYAARATVEKNVGRACKAACNSMSCKGGDKNCKTICCAAKAGDKIQNCCAAAGDSKCCAL